MEHIFLVRSIITVTLTLKIVTLTLLANSSEVQKAGSGQNPDR